jgi:conjugal transfer pilus assembly protein TraD
MPSTPHHLKIEHIFRPVFELNIATYWFLGALLTVMITGVSIASGSLSIGLMLAGVMLVVSVTYFIIALPYVRRQFRLSTNRKTFITADTLRAINRLYSRESGKGKDKREVYIGEGFEWGAEHAQRAYQVMDMDTKFSEVKLPFALKPIVKLFRGETRKLGGSPWIHGMGDEERKMIIEDTLYGHCFVAGQVGSGKTTLLKLFSINALHLGNILVILDPKNDAAWRESIRQEMAYLGKEDVFYHIHPSKPSDSARMALLKHFTRITEIGDRVAPLMGGAGGDSKPFQDFAYEIIFQAAQALHYLNRPIRLTHLQQTISADRRKLASDVFEKYFHETLGEGWQHKIDGELQQLDCSDPLEALYTYYVQYLKQHHANTVVDGVAQFALHDSAHYNKMVVTLRPVLTTLTASPLDQLFSPIDDPMVEDDRPIVNLKSLVEKGGVLCISLDSLSDGQSSSYLARLILAELAAVSGERYNNADTEARRVTIINDEVHASLENNDALLNILAQGRASSMQLILASQNVSDLEAKTDQATANRFLGLTNNFISMRTTDPKTQEYVSAQFSKNSITQIQSHSSSSGSTATSMLDFDVSKGERLMKVRENSFPEELLGQLPILQYVARLADGRNLKMRLPILINTDKPGARAPWLE